MAVRKWSGPVRRHLLFISGRRRSHCSEPAATFTRPISALPPVDPSILSIFRPRTDKLNCKSTWSSSLPNTVSPDLRWYLPWLAQQIAELPGCITNLISGGRDIGTIDLSLNSTFYRIFMTVNEYVCQGDSPSIDNIINYLVEGGVFESAYSDGETLFSPPAHPHILSAQRLLVFAILGWQSMLYLPSFNTCPLSELAIRRDIDQPSSGLVFDIFKLPADLANRPMAILLKGYGNLLPARSRGYPGTASETSRIASSWFPIVPSETNAYLLFTLLRIEIRWVDTLALHLDYDKSTRTLSLFRYPSFCVAMLQSNGALFSFASLDLNASDPRANGDEITDILHEILLSYRLLFGQSKPSRKLFRRLPNPNPTPFLHTMCTSKLFAHPYVPPDRSRYFVYRDFPVLGERVELLAKELSGAKPKSWKHLLRDRRDTTQYWTFWLVAIIGGSSILLSLIQVILQAIQIAQAHP